jgi:hypothetical protein
MFARIDRAWLARSAASDWLKIPGELISRGEDHPGSGQVVGGHEVPEERFADEAIVNDLLEPTWGVMLAKRWRGGQVP